MAALSDRLRIAQSVERNSVTVDLDGSGDMITLYAKPLTGMEIDKILLRHPQFATNPTIKAIVDVIIMKAEIESGDVAFDVADKAPLLMKNANLIHRIRAGLFPNDQVDLSDESLDAEMGN